MQIKSVLFSKANGSIGGLTGGQDQGGQYLRKKIQPRKKQTAMQKKHTDYFKEGNALFKTIRPYWYGIWAEYALTLTKTNALGIEITYSPAQAFMRSYVVYRQTGRDPVLLLRRINLKKGFYTLPQVSFSALSALNIITITNNINTAQRLLILISDDVSATTRKYRGGYKFLENFIIDSNAEKQIEVPPTKGKRWLKVIRYNHNPQGQAPRISYNPRVSKPVIYPIFKTA